MANQILTLKQIEDLFRERTMVMLGLDPDDVSKGGRVRIPYSTRGAPSFNVDENVAFVNVTLVPDLITKQRDVIYSESDIDNAIEEVKYTRVLNISWDFYGPSSFDDAEIIRNGLFLTECKEALAASNLYMVLENRTPVRVPELFNGIWWERVTFSSDFNEEVIFRSTQAYLKTTNIILHK